MSFPPDVVAMIMRHMNTDHAGDCAVICRALGGQPATTSAVMSGMDDQAAYFDATVVDTAGDTAELTAAGERVVVVRVPFSERLTERAQVRGEITRMYLQSCEQLGLPTRHH